MAKKASKYTNTTQAINDLTKQGYTGNLVVYDDDLAKLPNGETRTPADLVLQEVHRFDKHSCPADDLVLFALMDKTGQKLLVRDAFGKYGSEAVITFMSNVSKQTPTS